MQLIDGLDAHEWKAVLYFLSNETCTLACSDPWAACVLGTRGALYYRIVRLVSDGLIDSPNEHVVHEERMVGTTGHHTHLNTRLHGGQAHTTYHTAHTTCHPPSGPHMKHSTLELIAEVLAWLSF